LVRRERAHRRRRGHRERRAAGQDRRGPGRRARRDDGEARRRAARAQRPSDRHAPQAGPPHRSMRWLASRWGRPPYPRRAAAAIARAALIAAAPARAAGTADEAELPSRLGGEAFQKGDFSRALSHFFHSNRLVPNKNVLFNIATTYEQLKRFPDAYRYYVD